METGCCDGFAGYNGFEGNGTTVLFTLCRFNKRFGNKGWNRRRRIHVLVLLSDRRINIANTNGLCNLSVLARCLKDFPCFKFFTFANTDIPHKLEWFWIGDSHDGDDGFWDVGYKATEPSTRMPDGNGCHLVNTCPHSPHRDQARLCFCIFACKVECSIGSARVCGMKGQNGPLCPVDLVDLIIVAGWKPYCNECWNHVYTMAIPRRRKGGSLCVAHSQSTIREVP